MPTYSDPRKDSLEAAAALRGLAHASRVFDDPADTYVVLGDLLDGVRALEQVLNQVGATHLARRARAHDDHGNQRAGATAALAASEDLQRAARLIGEAERHLDLAIGHSGQIAWHPADAPEQTKRWIGVVRFQGRPAERAFALLNGAGPTAAITYLRGFDHADRTLQDAMENGYVCDAPPAPSGSRETFDGDYALVSNRALRHIALYRTIPATNDVESIAAPTRRGAPSRSARTAAKRDGFAHGVVSASGAAERRPSL